MNEFIFIGRIVNTHGIKGELRILSDFEKKERVFKPNIPIYIGKNKEKEEIENYRKHKQFDMITLTGYSNINEVLKYKGQNVYVERNILNLKEGEYLYEDLLGMEIMENKKVLGKIKDIVYNKSNILLYIEGEKNFYIPLNSEYIQKVDVEKGIVETKGGESLIL